MAPDHPDGDDEQHDTSPESAAVARGAARTAASSAGKSSASTATAATRGAMAGRIPAASRAAARAPKALPRTLPKVVGRAPKVKVGRPMAPRSVPRGVPRTAVPKAAPRLNVPRAGMPKSAPKLSARIPRSRAPRANTIAKASERASKGFDVLSAGLEQSESSAPSETRKERRAKLVNFMRQTASFGRIFVANTVLGMAVFATYEETIERMAPPLHPADDVQDNNSMSGGIDDVDVNLAMQPIEGDESSRPESDGMEDDEVDLAARPTEDDESVMPKSRVREDPMDRATLPQHFLAGALGGASHAVLSLALEIKLNPPSEARISSSLGKGHDATILDSFRQLRLTHIQLPAVSYSASSMLHHSLAHSVLFGSYQLTKRTLLHQSVPNSTKDIMSGSGSNDAVHAGVIAVAGGLAGQFQHVTSHFSERWLGLVADEAKNSTSSSPYSLMRRVASASWPSWRSTVLAFPPSAIGFLAFEYGKLMIAGDDG